MRRNGKQVKPSSQKERAKGGSDSCCYISASSHLPYRCRIASRPSYRPSAGSSDAGGLAADSPSWCGQLRARWSDRNVVGPRDPIRGGCRRDVGPGAGPVRRALRPGPARHALAAHRRHAVRAAGPGLLGPQRDGQRFGDVAGGPGLGRPGVDKYRPVGDASATRRRSSSVSRSGRGGWGTPSRSGPARFTSRRWAK